MSLNPLDYKDSPSPDRSAFVVFLFTTPSYLPGILVLHHSLVKYQSKYPLIVAVNPALPHPAVQALKEAGLEVRVVQPLSPVSKGRNLIAERFADTWTKVAVFDFVDFDRIVLIDGDMMLRRNMDELFCFPLPADHIAATFGCICNLDKSSWAPEDWSRENCGFTPSHHPTAMTHPPPALAEGTHSLINSGLVVLHPSTTTSDSIRSLLTSSSPSTQEQISSWMFPDQDLLGHVFRSKWINIPWTYNAIKTMRYWHGNFYRDEEVRNLHYICKKPWTRRPKRNTEAERGKTGKVYAVEAGKYEGVLDGEVGLDEVYADAVTHGWWWEEWEVMIAEMEMRVYPSLEYLKALTDQGSA